MERGILLDHARGIRDLTISVASRFSGDEAYRIPPSCNNCPIWNIGHLLIVQERLVLQPFGEQGVLPEAYPDLFGEGRCACDWNGNRPDWDDLLACLDPVRNRVEEFIESGVDLRTPRPEPYMTATGITLNTLGDSLSFSTLHEAIHVGVLITHDRLLSRFRTA